MMASMFKQQEDSQNKSFKIKQLKNKYEANKNVFEGNEKVSKYFYVKILVNTDSYL